MMLFLSVWLQCENKLIWLRMQDGLRQVCFFQREKGKEKTDRISSDSSDRAREEPTQTALRILYSRGSWQNNTEQKEKKRQN